MNPVCLAGTHACTLEEGGRTYRVLIAPPAGPAPPEGFPVLFLLDASVFFGTVVETVRLRSRRPDATGVTAALVVGIDCGLGSREERDRAYSWPGDAPALLEFITRRIRSSLGDEYSVNWQRQILLGHSLGGFFVLYALVTQPDAFEAYVALSPSIWFNRPYLLEGVRGLSARVTQPTKAFISVGEYEQSLAPWQSAETAATQDVAQRRENRAMVDNAHEFATSLRAVPALDVTFHRFPAEDHASAALAGIHHCLRFVLPPTDAKSVVR